MLHHGRARAEPQKPQSVPAVTELSGRNRRNVTTRRSGPQQCHIAAVRTGPARSAAGPGGTRTAANRACRLTQVLGARRRRKLRLSGMSPGPSRCHTASRGCRPVTAGTEGTRAGTGTEGLAAASRITGARPRRGSGHIRNPRHTGNASDPGILTERGQSVASRNGEPAAGARDSGWVSTLEGGRVGREDGLTGGEWMRSEGGGVDERFAGAVGEVAAAEEGSAVG
jgi:hypothetical protein